MIGLDGSSHNLPSAMPWAGHSFGFVRLTMGAEGVDGHALEHLSRARSAGVECLGVYHYLRGDSVGDAQAAHFWERVGKLEGGERLALAVDVEPLPSPLPAWPLLEYTTALQDFLQALQELAGRPCAVYGSPAYLAALGLPPWVASCPLWVAHWGTSSPSVPSPWKPGRWAIHQTGVEGSVDRNHFLGTPEDWHRTFGTLTVPHAYDTLGGVVTAIQDAAGGTPGRYHSREEGPMVRLHGEEEGHG